LFLPVNFTLCFRAISAVSTQPVGWFSGTIRAQRLTEQFHAQKPIDDDDEAVGVYLCQA